MIHFNFKKGLIVGGICIFGIAGSYMYMNRGYPYDTKMARVYVQMIKRDKGIQ